MKRSNALLQVAAFVGLIWGAWFMLDDPVFFSTRRPSSVYSIREDPRNFVKSCYEKGREAYPNLALNLRALPDGSFEDRSSFFRPYRVNFDDERGEWLLQQYFKGDRGEEWWQTLARFWDVDGDHFPDEVMLIVDSVRGREWTRRIDDLDWRLFARLKREGSKIGWTARLNSRDWSPEGGCYAWANPVTVLIDWAMMHYRWNPSLAL